MTYAKKLREWRIAVQQIEIDFEVFKALTALRQSETHTYNEVIRDLLGLKKTGVRRISDSFGSIAQALGPGKEQGFVASGRFLPDGTTLRARYKGQEFYGFVRDGRWLDAEGAEHSSASAAARAITQTNVNGLTFWEVKRPSDTNWTKLVGLPKS